MPAPLRHRHTAKEKLHLRRLKRKNGPSAKRRAERRASLQVKPTQMTEFEEARHISDGSEPMPATLAVSATAFADAMKELHDDDAMPGEHAEVIAAINEASHGEDPQDA